jgi:hypothetical protein
MAGSISAGAYTAGVLDYLFETFDKWEAEREKPDADCPTHKVVIEVFAGASGGGICAAISSVVLNTSNKYISGQNGKLFDLWVNLDNPGKNQDILHQIFSNSDMSSKEQFKSVLNANFLDEIADRAFSASPHKQVPWISKELDTAMTVSNLRGIPYAVSFAQEDNKQRMFDHKFIVRFNSDESNCKKNHEKIHLDTNKEGVINLIKEAAKATSAFPVGLRPRILTLDKKHVDNFPYEMATPQSNNDRIRPDWSYSNFEPYTFTCADGGMTNNEPFTVTRNLLLGKGAVKKTQMPRSPKEMDRAVIMVDPFPSPQEEKKPYVPERNIIQIIKSLVLALKEQSVFKVEDIMLAQDDTVYSRYLIVPKRNDEFKQHPIACGSLGGFGGFFSRDFRVHDFELGRRNCQRFLQKSFYIPCDDVKDNPIFKDSFSVKALDKFAYVNEKGVRVVPIIPDYNENAVDRPQFPQYDDEKELPIVRSLIRKRLFGVIFNMIIHLPKNKKTSVAIVIVLFMILSMILLFPFLLLVLLRVLYYWPSNRISKLIKDDFDGSLLIRKSQIQQQIKT